MSKIEKPDDPEQPKNITAPEENESTETPEASAETEEISEADDFADLEKNDGNKKVKKKRGRLGNILFYTVLVIVFLIGVGLLLYPSLGNVISCVQQHDVVDEYERQVALLLKKDIEIRKELAVDYNKSLKKITLTDPFSKEEQETETLSENENKSLEEYFEALSIGGENIMGYIKIPKISITIPIYHNATEVQLQKGIGHLTGTSLPIGGESTHCVLSGHTGVPGNMLFTDLDKLEVGDKFYIHVLDEVVAYEVDQIEVVEPDDTSKIQIEQGKDLCTLLTCTPYGVNSHRLLVRGQRTTYTPGEDDDNVDVIEVTNDSGEVIETKIAPRDYVDVFGVHVPFWAAYLLMPILCFLLIALITAIVRWRLKNTSEEEYQKKRKAKLLKQKQKIIDKKNKKQEKKANRKKKREQKRKDKGK